MGGLAVLFLLGFFTLRFIKKQHRFDSLFNGKDDDRNSTIALRKNPLESDFTTSYDYNPIGQKKPPSGITPPSSPPPGAQNPFSNSNSVTHGRRPSITPLLAGAGAAGGLELANNAVGSSSASHHTNGASASSRQGLLAQTPMSAGNVQPQGYYSPQPQQSIAGPSNAPAMSYPPKPQQADTWNAALLYGPSTSSAVQTGYAASALTPNPSVGSSTQQSTSTGLGYNTSVGSTATGATSWGAASSSTSTAMRRQSAQAGFGALGQQPQTQTQQTPMLFTQYEDPFARSGSPVSIQEQRILQVVNAEPSSPSNSSYAMRPLSTAQPLHVTNLNGAEQEAAGGAVVGGAAVPAARRTEKGVHLDGAMYQDPEGPPAYQR